MNESDYNEIEKYFNSIIVRLKRLNFQIKKLSDMDFNSIIVRLKQIDKEYKCLDFNNFNSIIVRLKHDRNRDESENKTEFQFYNSTIKTRRKIGIFGRYFKFSKSIFSSTPGDAKTMGVRRIRGKSRWYCGQPL